MTESRTDVANRAAYRRDMLPAIVGYAVLLAIAVAVVGDDVESIGEWAITLAPAIPALWGVRAVVRHLRRVDDYQRMLQLEAMASGFGVAMVVALTLGIVGAAGVASVATGWIVYGAGMLAWAGVAAVQGRA